VFSLTGKQLFETDHNLDTSDIQFLEDGEQHCVLMLFGDVVVTRKKDL